MSVILELSKLLMNRYIDQASLVVDATCGNGHDVAYLAELTKQVYAFDIQELAILSAKEKNKALKNITYIHDGHENLAKYIQEKLDLVVFNLGYLPTCDKSITTTFQTTKKAIEEAFKLLKPKKALLLTVYHGHPEGKKEAEGLQAYFEQVDKNMADIFVHQLINKPNTPPYIYEVVKR